MKLNKPLIYKILFWFVLFFLILVYNELARYGLADAKGAGHRDDQSIAFFILALILFLSGFKKSVARPAIISVMALLIIFAVVNWWYYDFYRDYLTPDTLKLAMYAEESSLAWDGLKYKKEALFFVLTMLAMLGIFFSLDQHKPKKKTLVISALVCLGFAIQQQVVLSDISRGGLKHRGVNHISYFIKGFIPAKKFELTDEHIHRLAEALPDKKIASADPKYPLFQDPGTSNAVKNPKNVIVVVLESVRMAETGLYGNTQDSDTPNLDRFARESLNFSRHYANSNQTVRGEMAILCSAMDYINGSPYSMGGDPLKANCLPSILKHYGYETHWIHGYKKKFFNRENFFPLLGFQHIHDMEVIDPAEEKPKIGWGIADTEVFDYALTTLEQKTTPFFAEILTLSNHYPYLWDWGIDFPDRLELNREYVEEEDNLYPAYQRGIYYTDYALGQFIERFKQSKLYENTLLVVTADHGIWTFPDQMLQTTEISNELKKNEMYFRLPLLIHAANLDARQIDVPVSQVDIAPSVLDYLGVEFPNAFLGESLLTQALNENRPVYVMSSGSYGVRRNNQYCYPVETSDLCSTYYRKCDSYTKSDAKTICVSTDEDMLVSTDQLTAVEVDISSDDVFINLTQRFLEYGYIPPEQMLELPVTQALAKF